MKQHALYKLVTTFLIAAMVVLTVIIGVMPKIETVQSNNTVAVATQKQTQHQNRQLARLANLDKDKNSWTTRLAALGVQVPAEAATSGILVEVQNLANARGLKISSLNVGEAKAFIPGINLGVAALASDVASVGTGRLFSQVVTLGAIGNFDRLTSFMNSLRNLQRNTLVYSGSLNRSQDPGAKVEASASVTFEVFYLK